MPDQSGFIFRTQLTPNNNDIIQSNASRLDRLYVSEKLLIQPNIWRDNGIRASADYLSIIAELQTVPGDPPTYHFPNYLLASTHYLNFLHNNIRDFLLTQSEVAESYNETQASPLNKEFNKIQLEPKCWDSPGRHLKQL